jgi:hypothetical protein
VWNVTYCETAALKSTLVIRRRSGQKDKMRHHLIYFERSTAPVLPRRLFIWRVVRISLVGFGVLAIGLGLGMVGYRLTEKMTWVDAFVNASMILSGMGPVSTLETRAGKLFAGCYALFSGLAFITVAGLILGPFVHRIFHKFHLVDKSDGK